MTQAWCIEQAVSPVGDDADCNSRASHTIFEPSWDDFWTEDMDDDDFDQDYIDIYLKKIGRTRSEF